MDARILAIIKEDQKESLNKELDKFREIKERRGKSAAIFAVKNEVVGSKKIGQEATTVLDPDTNKEITDPDKIKTTVLKYCKNLLINIKQSTC